MSMSEQQVLLDSLKKGDLVKFKMPGSGEAWGICAKVTKNRVQLKLLESVDYIEAKPSGIIVPGRGRTRFERGEFISLSAALVTGRRDSFLMTEIPESAIPDESSIILLG